MTKEKLKEILNERDSEAVIFEEPDYADAVIGISDEGRVVYSYDEMAKSLMQNDNMSYDDAVEFIEYNTIRALPYFGPKAPIVVYDIKDYI